MLTTAVMLPLLVVINTQAPSLSELKEAKQVINPIKWAAENNVILVAGGRRRAPGPDHGDDPNEEQHDPGLPANQEAGNGFPSSDPYNDSLPNRRKPY